MYAGESGAAFVTRKTFNTFRPPVKVNAQHYFSVKIRAQTTTYFHSRLVAHLFKTGRLLLTTCIPMDTSNSSLHCNLQTCSLFAILPLSHPKQLWIQDFPRGGSDLFGTKVSKNERIQFHEVEGLGASSKSATAKYT